jgi:branched-chain amino acid transport system ATP-binding protein
MLEVEKLDAWYGDSHVLQGVSLGVPDGGRVAVVGRNGAGKTTLMKSLMNAGPRTAGSVRWEGEALGSLPDYQRARRGLCLVPEDRRIFPHLTVAENIVLAQTAGSAERRRTPEELFERFPMLGPLKARMGSQLSGGQQQMLAVARGFAARPKLLLLDEPTEGLAPVIVQAMAKELVAACQADGAALLLCEQNLWFARRCTERVIVIDIGRVVFDGDWAEFDRRPEIKNRYLAV